MEKLVPGRDFIIAPISAATSLKTLETEGDNNLPLKIYFRRQALKHHLAHFAKTYVATPADSDDKTVLGYISIVVSEIAKMEGQMDDCQTAQRYQTWPAAKIARLCSHHSMIGRGVGTALIEYVTAIVLDDVMPVIGCRFMVTDAKSDAVGFYEKAGFSLVDTDENRAKREPVMFMDLKPHLDEEGDTNE